MSIPKKGNTTAFVQGLPMEMPAKEVVEAGKKAGIQLTPKRVWVVRSEIRHKNRVAKVKDAKKTKKQNARRRVARRRNKAVKTTVTQGKVGHPTSFTFADKPNLPSIEAEFRKLIIRIGTDRARSMILDLIDELEDL